MAKNAPTITVDAGDLVLCNDGSSEAYYTACPSTWSLGALPAVATGGWQSVTTAVDATGTGTRYDIGGGNNYGTDLADVPWGSLQAGDAVNIYHRTEPYREKVVITETGTEANPIIINGVTNITGDRPVIDGENAVALNPTYLANDAFRAALVFIHRKSTAVGGVYGETADYIQFQNFELKHATQDYSYTHDGTTENYAFYGRLIWVYANEYVTVENCIFDTAADGLFAGAPAEKPCKTLTVRGNRFINTGHLEPGENAGHQIYVGAYCETDEFNIIEGNYFDAIGDPDVAQCKVRSSGTVIRYNTFRAGARTIDLVEAQDELVPYIWDNYTAQEIIDKYRTSYIYGNLFMNDENIDTALSAYPIHAGWDSNEFYTFSSALGEPTGRGVDGGATYFFHNTLHYESNYAESGLYRGGLFDVDGASATTDESRVVAANNVIVLNGTTRQAQMRHSGRLDWESTNLIDSSGAQVFAESDAYANADNTGDDPAILINNNDTRVTTAPLFVDPDNANVLLRDYSLDTGSPALNAATSLPAALSAYPVEYNPVNPATGIRTARSATNDLGAFE